MKTILIPTDFSDASKNASVYGIQLAKQTKSKVILLHSYHIPTPATEVPILVNYEELEKVNVDRLDKEKKILDANGELEIDCIVLAGFAVDNIIEIEESRNIDIVVMGMRGVGAVAEYLIGSVTTAFIKKSTSLVIVVPEKASYSYPKKITYACDYSIDPEESTLEPLKSFAKLFDSDLMVLNLLKEKDLTDTAKAVVGVKLENYLKDISHNYYFLEDDDFVHGINHFVEQHETDLIAVIPHKHSLIERMFKETHTKRLAFHTSIPLLVIPEKRKKS